MAAGEAKNTLLQGSLDLLILRRWRRARSMAMGLPAICTRRAHSFSRSKRARSIQPCIGWSGGVGSTRNGAPANRTGGQNSTD